MEEEKITISKTDLISIFKILGEQNRLGHPRLNRIVLARYYFLSINSGIELEDYTYPGINELWEEFKNVYTK